MIPVKDYLKTAYDPECECATVLESGGVPRVCVIELMLWSYKAVEPLRLPICLRLADAEIEVRILQSSSKLSLMAQVRGIGGVFFKAADPNALYGWYEKHLGIAGKPGRGAMFRWQAADGSGRKEVTSWSIFPDTTKYMKDSKADFMLNYIVDDLDAMLTELKAAGVSVDDHVERHEYGNFGWITDPAGNRIELWEPKAPTTQSPEDTKP